MEFPDTMDVPFQSSSTDVARPITAERLAAMAAARPVPSWRPAQGYSFNRCGVFPVHEVEPGFYRRSGRKGEIRKRDRIDLARVFPTCAEAVAAFRREKEMK